MYSVMSKQLGIVLSASVCAFYLWFFKTKSINCLQANNCTNEPNKIFLLISFCIAIALSLSYIERRRCRSTNTIYTSNLDIVCINEMHSRRKGQPVLLH